MLETTTRYLVPLVLAGVALSLSACSEAINLSGIYGDGQQTQLTLVGNEARYQGVLQRNGVDVEISGILDGEELVGRLDYQTGSVGFRAFSNNGILLLKQDDGRVLTLQEGLTTLVVQTVTEQPERVLVDHPAQESDKQPSKAVASVANEVEQVRTVPAAARTQVTAEVVAAEPPFRGSGVWINRVELSEDEQSSLAAMGLRIEYGRYWYDNITGAWGMEGAPTGGWIAPSLPVQAPMPEDISEGDTSVYFNGRELPVLDWYLLSQLAGAEILPGRYFLDQYGNAGFEDGPVLINFLEQAQMLMLLAGAVQQGNQGGGDYGGYDGGNNGGGQGGNWTSALGGGAYDGNGAGFVQLPNGGFVSHGM